MRKTNRVANALESFIQGVYWAEQLRQNESLHNLEESIVEITMHGKHSSNGLLITRDGYFLTAKHCVDFDLGILGVRLTNGESYRIQKKCFYKPKEDIALVKAEIPAESEAIGYKFFNTNKLGTEPVAVLTRKNGKLDKRYGLMGPHTVQAQAASGQGLRLLANQLVIKTIVRHGDSGGAIVSYDGRLVGLLCTSDMASYATGAKIMSCLDTVYCEAQKLKKQNRSFWDFLR